MSFDFFAEYYRIHRAVYGRDPCTREQWEEWCRHRQAERVLTDIEFDYAKEREGDAQ